MVMKTYCLQIEALNSSDFSFDISILTNVINDSVQVLTLNNEGYISFCIINKGFINKDNVMLPYEG